MKFCFCFLAILTAAYAGENGPAAKSGEAKSGEAKRANRTAATAPAQPVTAIPTGAIETSPGTWYHTDPQGKGWFYRKTPFGVSRTEEKPAADPEKARLEDADLKSITAAEEGDVIRFERRGPFGVYKWSRAKGELNDMERKAWERARDTSAPRETRKQE